MITKSKDEYIAYIRKRELANQAHEKKVDCNYEKEIKRLYTGTIDAIDDQVDAWVGRYASREGITVAEANKVISRFDADRFKDKAARYVKEKDFSPHANAELKKYNLKMRVSRMELLKRQMMLELIGLASEEERMLKERLQKDATRELERQAVILGMSVGTKKTLKVKTEAVLKASLHSATFSDRIWANMEKTKQTLDRGVTRSILIGDNPKAWAKNLKQYIRHEMLTKKGSAAYISNRLAITESARVQGDIAKRSYQAMGYKKYIWIAEPDACPVCAALNEEIFRFETDAPSIPMHPFCRCSIAAYYDEDKVKEVDLPREFDEARELTEDIKDGIRAALDKVTSEYDVKINKISYVDISHHGSVPFQFNPLVRGAQFQPELIINRGFDWNESVAAFNDRIYNKNYKKNILSSQSLEDLIYHEAAHFMTFQDCNTYKDFLKKEAEVREMFMPGISIYNSTSNDGAETIAEGFVAMKNGDDVPENIERLVKRFIRRKT